MTKSEMVGWHRLLDRHEFEQALGVGDGQESHGRQPTRAVAVHGVAKSQAQLSN